MSKNIMHSRHDEYHKLTRGERIGYGMGDFAQNLVFGTIGGFLALHMLTVNTISTATAGFIFLFVRIINVFWDPMVGTYVDKRTSKAGKYRPWLLRAGVPLVILSALLFAPIPGVKGSVAFAFIIYLALDLVYSLVNIPYGSLNASLTRDPESIDKLTSTRMMLANSANLLVYTLFPMFVQMAAPKDRSLKDTGFFGLELNLGNYTESVGELRLVWRVRHLYDHRRGGPVYLLQMHQRTRCRDRRADRQRQNYRPFPRAQT